MKPLSLTLVLLTAGLSGCVSVQMPAISETHPAHAEAEAGAIPGVSAALSRHADPVIAPELPIGAGAAHADRAPAPSIDHSAHGMADPAPADDPQAPGSLYVCPMHPEVTSDKPGKCPKCGMDLELREKSS